MQKVNFTVLATKADALLFQLKQFNLLSESEILFPPFPCDFMTSKISPSDNYFLTYISSMFPKSLSVYLRHVSAFTCNIHFKTLCDAGFSALLLPRTAERPHSLKSITKEFLWVVVIDVRIMPFLNYGDERDIQDDIANHIHGQNNKKR